ncbi:MraY family glycosyltransferase [Noviherbaspirillum cavernae]|nr:glycosyltransferase [Noviherbaspirillum cavernae]
MAFQDIVGIIAIAALASCVVSLLIVLTQAWHGSLSLDKDVAGVQKFHKKPVPRIGGVALVAGVVTAIVYGAFDESPRIQQVGTVALLKLLLASMPAFLAGLLEDMTKRVSVMARLLAAFASALLACWLLGAWLPRLDTWGFDQLLRFTPFAIAVTMIAVAGVSNSINIIDGFHGVAGSAAVIILAALGFLAWQADDMLVTRIALMGIGAAIGFLMVNYPTGRLFMGDGGAYFLGFWIAETAVLLVARNPSINAWQVLAVCAYPVIEVMYSIYRRKIIRKMSPGDPDRLHLHTLIYRRVVCQIIPRNDAYPWIRNSAVACVVASIVATMTLGAVHFGDGAIAAPLIVLGEVLLYMALYTRLVRGRWCLDPTVILGLRPAPAVREWR